MAETATLAADAWRPPDDALFRAIQHADDERCRAMVEGDLVALERLLGDDLTYTHSSALCEGKRDYLASLASGRVRYLHMRRDALRVRVYGELALLDGKVVIEAVVGGVGRVLDNRFLSAWRCELTGWRMVAWASTPIPASA